MREYEYIIDESLTKGLNPEHKILPLKKYLTECVGFKCGVSGLEKYGGLSNGLIGIDLYYNWPYPQMIKGEKYNVLIVRENTILNEDTVYIVDDDNEHFEQIASIDALTHGVGSLMELADFGEYAFMTNGVAMIYWDPDLAIWSMISTSPTIPMMRTICNFKGQVIGGNIVSDWYDCDETFYIWSRIGSMDFTHDGENESGYRKCPYGGVVKNVRRLGDNVVGYSSKGITLIYPVNEPTTFGFKELHNIGIINQGAVNGTLDYQVYLGTDYILRSITSEGIKELGYKHFMQKLEGEDVIINYDPNNKDFYIGNSNKTFLLSPNGLTEIKQHPSTVWSNSQETSIIPDAEDDQDIKLCSEIFDMGYKGEKTIFTVESGIFSASGIKDKVYAADAVGWVESTYVPFNNMNISSLIIAGDMFKIELTFEELLDDFYISYIKARYKMTDLRGIRGVYAPPPRGQ